MKNKSYPVKQIFIFLVGFLIFYAIAFIIPSNTTVFACGTDIDCGSGQECTNASCDPETQLCSGGSCTNVGETQPNQQECFHCSSVSGGFCERSQIPVTEPCGSDCAGCPGGSQPGGSPPPSPPPLPAASNPNSVCSYDNRQRVTLSWDQITGASAYILRVDSYATSSPSWVDYTDFIVGTSSNSICSGGRCSFLSGTLGNMWNSYCPITGRTCDNVDFTNGPTDIYPNSSYGWSVQGIAPGESYPFAGGRAEGGFNCGCTVTGARCGTITSNSVTIENISWTDSGWGANGMFIDNTGNPAGLFPGYFIPFFASTYTVTGLTPGTYTYNVACYKDFGGGSSMIGYSGPFTCTIPAAPTLGLLTVVPDTASGGVIGQKYGTSGLRSEEGGSNYYNALKITQSINNSSSAALVGTAFVSSTSLPANNTLYELTKSAFLGNGFVLLYASQNKTTNYYTSTGGTASYLLNPNNYYAYFKGDWRGPIPVNDIDYFPITPPYELRVQPLGGGASAPQFSVTLYKNLGNRNWKTYGYVMDNSNAETATAEQACNGAGSCY